jgi:hypothetical protein
MININCQYNDCGAWCKNKNIKRSLFGLGARCCILYPGLNGKTCAFQVMYNRPTSPPSPRRKEYHAKFLVVQK